MQAATEKISTSASTFPSLQHFRTLMGPFGMYQHGEGLKPRLSEGYCTDDNARAVQLLIEIAAADIKTDLSYEDMLETCWQFLRDAQNTDGTYKNFRDIHGTWLDSIGSEDTQARVARLLSTIIIRDTNTERITQAWEMLKQLLPSLEKHSFIRSLSESLLSLMVLQTHPKFQELAPTVEVIGKKVIDLWTSNAKDSWPWPEPELTYANGLICHGLLVYVIYSQDTQLEQMLHAATTFLINATVTSRGFIPIGNHGWYTPQDVKPAEYDQQPIEAHTMFDFLLAYSATYPDRISTEQIAAPYTWFFGYNTQHIQMGNPTRGICWDGLNTNGPNKNVGAESLLAYIRSAVLFTTAPKGLHTYIQSL